MTKEDILNKAHSLSEKAEVVGKIMPKSSIIAASIDMAEWVLNNLWKPADGDDLPEIDREVVVLTQPYPLENLEYAVFFAHRPNPNGWDGKSLTSGKVEHYTPKTYDKGGWNIPNVKFWLDVELPQKITRQ